jgi:hypothetical protein
MADTWQTYPFEFRGGLISNLSPLQHGIQAPGSARLLRNFEPSIEGGYRRILGFDKYSSTLVPTFGNPVVQGSGQTGSTLVIANLYIAPQDGDSFTIAGVTGTYTIAAAGVSYSSANKSATVTLTSSLNSSPADKAAITFTNDRGLIIGLAAWEDAVIAVRNNNMYLSTGSAWTRLNVPSYGTVLVNGGTQTGTSLAIDGLTGIPQQGDTFTIAGVEKVYTVLSTPTVTGGGATVSINPALDSSPADNAVITFLTANKTGGQKSRFAKYRIGTTEKICFVDSVNYPVIWDKLVYSQLNQAPTDVLGAEHIVWFKNQLFFAKGDLLSFTSPYTDNDFNPANGAGSIAVGSKITGLTVFREQLIIFCENKIERLTGNTLADFVKQPITENIGCVESDTIQEVGSDIMFLGPDGLRLLSATDRLGDFNLAVVSKTIQKETTQFINASTSFASIVIKKKSQYRIFGYKTSIGAPSSLGLLGTQLIGEEGITYNWAELRGIRAYVADSNYKNKNETIVFANGDGFVYEMETGNSFNGADINATFATPYVPINDPRIRKTFYKMFLYTDPAGSVTINASLKLDFDDTGTIQPTSILLSNDTGVVGFYGSPVSIYGVTLYGDKLKTLFESQLIGSGFSVSLQFISNGKNPPFSLDAATLEFATHDRR